MCDGSSSFCVPGEISAELLTGRVDSRFFILGDDGIIRKWKGGTVRSQKRSFAGFSFEILSLETEQPMDLYMDKKSRCTGLFLAAEGKMKVAIPGGVCACAGEEGAGILLVTGKECTLRFMKGKCIFYHLIFSRAYASRLFRELLGLRSSLRRSCQNAFVNIVSAKVADEYIAALMRLISMTGEDGLPVVLSWFIRKCCATIPGAGSLVLSGREKVMECAGYVTGIRRDDACPTVAALANRFSITPGALSKTFKAIFAVGLKAFILRVKMEEAQRLLGVCGSSVTDVSYHLGYHSPYSFGTAFKKYFGYAPGSILFARRNR